MNPTIYYPMAIVYEKGREPYLWSPSDPCLKFAQAKSALRWYLQNYDVFPVVTWIQSYTKGTSKDLDITYYVDAFGLTKYPDMGHTINESEV